MQQMARLVCSIALALKGTALLSIVFGSPKQVLATINQHHGHILQLQ